MIRFSNKTGHLTLLGRQLRSNSYGDRDISQVEFAEVSGSDLPKARALFPNVAVPLSVRSFIYVGDYARMLAANFENMKGWDVI